MALQQGLEARRQQVQAEGLIEFMLGDLRRKLEPVGRLDVLDAVGERALAYYAAQQAGHGLDADSLGRRARALHLIGELAEKRGQLDEAARSFRDAAAATEELLSREPANPVRIFDQAQSEYWVGFVALGRRDTAEAEVRFKRYLALAEQLVGLDGERVDWQLELAYAHSNLGVLYLDARRLPEALAMFTTSLSIREKLAGRQPGLYRELAGNLGWIARVHEADGDYQRAIEVEWRKMDMAGREPGADADKGVQYLLANARQVNARRYLWLGQLDEARRMADLALSDFEALNVHDPANLSWQEQTAIGRVEWIDVAIALGDAEGARAQLARLDAQIARLDPAVTTKASWAIFIEGGRLLARAGLSADRATTTTQLAAFLDKAARRQVSGKPWPMHYQRTLAQVGMVLGDRLAEAGQVPAARERWAAAAARVESLSAAGSLPAMALRALIVLRMGQADEARELARRLQSSAFRHPHYEELARTLARHLVKPQTP